MLYREMRSMLRTLANADGRYVLDYSWVGDVDDALTPPGYERYWHVIVLDHVKRVEWLFSDYLSVCPWMVTISCRLLPLAREDLRLPPPRTPMPHDMASDAVGPAPRGAGISSLVSPSHPP